MKLFIKRCMDDNIIIKYYPYAAMGRLCFSRWGGYPYSNDCPSVCKNTNDDNYNMNDCHGNRIYEGDMEDILRELRVHLLRCCKEASCAKIMNRGNGGEKAGTEAKNGGTEKPAETETKETGAEKQQ
jgi:hypothetical protein